MRDFINQWVFLILIGCGLAIVAVDHVTDRLDIEIQQFNSRIGD